jgi:hypothetical protein
MIKTALGLLLLIALSLPPAAVAATTEPGRNGARPIQVTPKGTGNNADAPGGVGPGFDAKDAPNGIVAPGAIGPYGIEPQGNSSTGN